MSERTAVLEASLCESGRLSVRDCDPGYELSFNAQAGWTLTRREARKLAADIMAVLEDGTIGFDEAAFSVDFTEGCVILVPKLEPSLSILLPDDQAEVLAKLLEGSA